MVAQVGMPGPPQRFYQPRLQGVFWCLQAICWLVYAVAAFLLVLGPEAPASGSLFTLKVWRSLLGFLAAMLIYAAMRRMPRSNTSASVATIGALSSIVLGYGWFVIFRMSVNLYIHRPITDWSFFRYSRDSIEQIAILLAWSAVYVAMDHWQDALNERTRAEAAEANSQRARWQMLQSQINPHFLFNTLNSLRASIDENSEQARQMVTHLSEFLRYALVCDERQLVPLKKEVAIVADYLSIEKARFEDRLQITYSVDAAAENAKVPRFLLQPLVENAVKHGMITSSVPLRVTIRGSVKQNNLKLEVENSGHWSPANATDGFGLGLTNLKERLKTLYDSGYELTVTEENSRVRVAVTIDLAHGGACSDCLRQL
jgi:two-component system LytT family sensor kinase